MTTGDCSSNWCSASVHFVTVVGVIIGFAVSPLLRTLLWMPVGPGVAAHGTLHLSYLQKTKICLPAIFGVFLMAGAVVGITTEVGLTATGEIVVSDDFLWKGALPLGVLAIPVHGWFTFFRLRGFKISDWKTMALCTCGQVTWFGMVGTWANAALNARDMDDGAVAATTALLLTGTVLIASSLLCRLAVLAFSAYKCLTTPAEAAPQYTSSTTATEGGAAPSSAPNHIIPWVTESAQCPALQASLGHLEATFETAYYGCPFLKMRRTDAGTPVPVTYHDYLDKTSTERWADLMRTKDGVDDEKLPWVLKFLLKSRTVKELSQGPALYRLYSAHRDSGNPDCVIVPEMYLQASGEAFVITCISAWAVTAVWNPGVIDRNPLKDLVGYNNVCVGFDEPPARFLAVPLFVVVAALGIRYAQLDTLRAKLQLRDHEYKISNFRYGFTTFANNGYVFFSCLMPLLLVVTPTVSQMFHTFGFMFIIIFCWLVIFANFFEAKVVTRESKIWLVTFSVCSVSVALIGIIDFRSYDYEKCRLDVNRTLGIADIMDVRFDSLWDTILMEEHREACEQSPGAPWWLLAIFDYGWFFLLSTVVVFLPDAPPVHVDFELVREIKRSEELGLVSSADVDVTSADVDVTNADVDVTIAEIDATSKPSVVAASAQVGWKESSIQIPEVDAAISSAVSSAVSSAS